MTRWCIALSLLYNQVLEISDKSSSAIVKTKRKEKMTIGDIFTGLVKVGSNDRSYKNNPSALSLATFRVHDSIHH